MRIPREKIYRAFPELDPFSDQECERFVLQVKTQKRIGPWPAAAFIAVFLFLALVVYPALGFAALNIRIRIRSDQFRTLTAAALLALLFGLPFLAALLTRDRRLRRAIEDRINSARCSRCRHSLLGLPLLDEDDPDPSVRCPECGQVLRLANLGLTPADLIPRSPSPRS
jgi:DNA-directed RNA polymerase subunit RPC12/RpoP